MIIHVRIIGHADFPCDDVTFVDTLSVLIYLSTKLEVH